MWCSGTGAPVLTRAVAERGALATQFALGLCFHHGLNGAPVDLPEALLWMRRAAAGNVCEALVNIGMAHELGSSGLPAGGAEGPVLYRRAPDAGLGMARYRLGVCYSKGRGITRDAAEAVRHWRIESRTWLPSSTG